MGSFLLLAFLFFIGMYTLNLIFQEMSGDKAVNKGKKGEKRVAKLLQQLDDTYTIYHDIYIEKKDGNMSQLDHVIISKFGIFVIETKNFSGWIFGNQKQRNWTQVLYKKKSQFYNPIMQNKAHIKALTNYLQVDRNTFSFIVFSDAATFKFEEDFQDVTVLKMKKLLQEIKGYNEVQFTTRQIEIVNERMDRLMNLKGKKKTQVANEHINYVKEVQEKVENKYKKATTTLKADSIEQLNNAKVKKIEDSKKETAVVKEVHHNGIKEITTVKATQENKEIPVQNLK